MSNIIKCYLLIILTVLANGCMFGVLDLGQSYIGNYSVHSEAAKRSDFGGHLKSMATEIARKLGYRWGINENAGGEIAIGISSKDLQQDGKPRVQIWWFNNSSRQFSITIIKSGRDETAETKRVRECIESVLNEDTSFRWSYDIAHGSLLR